MGVRRRSVLDTAAGIRVLGEADLPYVRSLVARDPLVNLFVDYRLETTRLHPRWLGGQMLGYYEDGRLTAACHVAANLVPVGASAAAVDAFARRILADRRVSSSIVGPREQVERLWHWIAPAWGPARSLRLNQPFMQIDTAPVAAPDPRVRRVMLDETDLLYPASVAMFTEEVGESPEAPGRHSYRARVSQLISRGWSFAIIEHGQVVFKADVGSATAAGVQIQGVYVDPAHRGHGIAVGAMAAVVDLVRRDIAPAVTLYVNDYNHAAMRTYERVGFVQTETFSSILF